MTEYRKEQLSMARRRISEALIEKMGDDSDLILIADIIKEQNACHGCYTVNEAVEMIING